MARTNEPPLTRRLTPRPAAVLLVILAGVACLWAWSEVPAAARHADQKAGLTVEVVPTARAVVASTFGSRVAGNVANAE